MANSGVSDAFRKLFNQVAEQTMSELSRDELFEALTNVQAELETAQRNLDEAQDTLKQAHREETACINKVNELQKEFSSTAEPWVIFLLASIIIVSIILVIGSLLFTLFKIESIVFDHRRDYD